MSTITICGLGPGGTGRVTEETATLLAGSDRIFLRTARHPGVEELTGTTSSFDYCYEQASSFEEVYRTISAEVLKAAAEHGHVVYAVPGSPLVLERSVRHLRAAAGVDIKLLPAVSFLDEVWARLQIDPVDDGVRMVDGLRFAVDAADQRGPLLVAHAHADWVLSDIKLAIDAGPEQKVIVLQSLGTDDERVFEVEWPDLDRAVEADHLTTLYIPELAAPAGYELARSVEMMRRLRSDCPWDQKQTHRSLRKYLIEEAYEVIDAIDDLQHASSQDSNGEGSAGGDSVEGGPVQSPDASAYTDLEEELGDLWFQILFHAELASEAGQFTIAEVAQGLTDKMIRRHPHVYANKPSTDDASIDGSAADGPAVDGSAVDGATVASWEQLKKDEKGRGSVLDGIPRSLPALSLAEKTLKKADGIGAKADLGPLQTQLADLASQDDDLTPSQLGALLLAIVEIGRERGIESEQALRETVDRAAQRLRTAETEGRTDGLWVRG
ncbi:MAG: MazG nucleotide pyrophosphohydrolase domain-containing protein [Acidimicrobiales bacterium]